MAPKKKAVSPIADQIKEITGGYKPIATPKDATGMQGVGITGTDRNVAKEIEAAKIGYSAEYIASRGGINSQGYFNDVALSGQLTAAEQKSVTLSNGSVNTAAMAKILQQKQIAEKVKNGMSVAEATRQVSAQYGEFGIGMPEAGYDSMGNKTPGGQYSATGEFVGSVSGGANVPTGSAALTGAGVIPTVPSAETMQKRVSAWTVLKDKFDSWGLGTLAESVKELILDGASDEELTIRLREKPEYAKRFAGNVDRKKAGLNVYDEGTYLALENAYAEAFTSYGQQSLLGKTAEEKQANFATYIGGTIAPTEIKRRLQVATDLAASDSATKAAIKQLYPMITDGDLVAYFLKPSETLPKLEVKAQAAKIGGAFLKQGLATDAVSAEEYVAAGVTEEQAQAGAAAVAEVLPRGEFLSDITAGAPDYTQKTAEEVYLKGLASAKRAQDQLRQAEIGRFSGSSGTNKTSLSEQKFGLI
jgi:hypothetical protein